VIDHLDHLVLTTADEQACIRFYTEVLGMQLESFVGGTPPVERKAFRFGIQKINLHVKGREFEPKAKDPIHLPARPRPQPHRTVGNPPDPIRRCTHATL
jgi:catechol 2,3-dioxygenase-like lactoylglutathione lyase family enzyme